jgi:SRSO17 transposase
METFAHPEAVLVIDETGFLKEGKRSCGVARMYTGAVRKVTNCQIGVFMLYASILAHAFIDRDLYMPEEWISDPARCKAAHVPGNLKFMTKPQMAQMMIGRAIAAGVPFSSVAAGSVYGSSEMEQQLHEAGKS